MGNSFIESGYFQPLACLGKYAKETLKPLEDALIGELEGLQKCGAPIIKRILKENKLILRESSVVGLNQTSERVNNSQKNHGKEILKDRLKGYLIRGRTKRTAISNNSTASEDVYESKEDIASLWNSILDAGELDYIVEKCVHVKAGISGTDAH